MFARVGGSPSHSLIASNLIANLSAALKDSPCQVHTSDLRVALEATNAFVYPDVTVVCAEPKFYGNSDDVLTNPILVIEVLSPSTEGYDRGEKFAHYRRLVSLREYVLVSQSAPQVDRYSPTTADDWLLRSASGLDAKIELASVGVSIALSDIYSKIVFPPTTRQLELS